MIIKKDYESRGGVMRGLEKDEPSISEFSNTPTSSHNGESKKRRRFKRHTNGSDDSLDHFQNADSPSKVNKSASPEKAAN